MKVATTGNLVCNRELFYQDTTAPATKTSLSNGILHTLIEKDHLGDRSPEKDCC